MTLRDSPRKLKRKVTFIGKVEAQFSEPRISRRLPPRKPEIQGPRIGDKTGIPIQAGRRLPHASCLRWIVLVHRLKTLQSRNASRILLSPLTGSPCQPSSPIRKRDESFRPASATDADFSNPPLDAAEPIDSHPSQDPRSVIPETRNVATRLGLRLNR